MKKPFFIAILFILCPIHLFCQEYGYTHYGIKEGLPSATIYCMAQDKEGFLWFGTEAGLCRFDGTHFKTFTTRDGLPDNEIIQLFVDSRGRLWMAPFKNTVVYYYQGKMHTPENDSVLAKLNFTAHAWHFAEDRDGNILIQEYTRLHLVKTNGDTDLFSTVNGRNAINFVAASPAGNGGFNVIESDSLYELTDRRFKPIVKLEKEKARTHPNYVALNQKLCIFQNATSYTKILHLTSGKTVRINDIHATLKYCFINDSLCCFSTASGVRVYNSDGRLVDTYLSGKPVSDILKDTENSIWFATSNDGVYRLNSQGVKNISLKSHPNDVPGVLAIFKRSGQLYFSTEQGLFHKISITENNICITGKYRIKPAYFKPGISTIEVLDNNDIVCGSTNHLVKMSPDFRVKVFLLSTPIKSILQINRHKLLIATPFYAATLDPADFVIKDTVWKERATTAFFRKDTFYIGALNGLHLVLKDKSVRYLGATIPLFRNRITAIREAKDGTLWMATYGEGIVGYRNQQIVAHLTTDNGLTSNLCRNLFLNGHYLWVGTDKGLNKIDVSGSKFPVVQYTMADGLASDVIYTMLIDSPNVFIGSPEVFSWFDESKLRAHSVCDLRITGIAVAGRQLATDTNNLIIPHRDNNIRVEYAGISFRSAGDIVYKYRLTGLDSTWATTRETFLSYPTLPSGDYTLQIQATNKFGVVSELVTIQFTIEKLLTEKNWFRILAGFVLLGLISLLVVFIARRIRRQEAQKTSVAKRISELEQLALKSQMNPHFIFNSLNSIQNYVMDKDIEGANRYITSFSRLIRQTLYFSSKQQISLAEEINYLSTYLELEKMRTEDAFVYQVQTDPDIHLSDYLIPPMILQPFVENAVRHGIRFRKDKAGEITIHVTRQDDHIRCILQDNGIGRKAAAGLKSHVLIEYQSKGMSLTADRIEMFNKNNPRNIGVQVIDLEDEAQQALGTRIVVDFPVYTHND